MTKRRFVLGQFKERAIEETDQVLKDIEAVKKGFHDMDDSVDFYSLFLPHYDEELGGLLPHERRVISVACLIKLFRK